MATDEDMDAGTVVRRWQYSPQSRKACNTLKDVYGGDDGDLEKAWADGWRWHPVPAPKTMSHEHRFFPPTAQLAAARSFCSADKPGALSIGPVCQNVITARWHAPANSQHAPCVSLATSEDGQEGGAGRRGLLLLVADLLHVSR